MAKAKKRAYILVTLLIGMCFIFGGGIGLFADTGIHSASAATVTSATDEGLVKLEDLMERHNTLGLVAPFRTNSDCGVSGCSNTSTHFHYHQATYNITGISTAGDTLYDDKGESKTSDYVRVGTVSINGISYRCYDALKALSYPSNVLRGFRCPFSYLENNYRYAIVVPKEVSSAGKSDFNKAINSKPKDYVDFSSYPEGTEGQNTRERVGGFVFEDGSVFREIVAAKDTGNYPTDGPESCFYRCDNMGFFILPQGTTTIGRTAFYKCKQLRDLVIPDTVTSIGKVAFCECEQLKHISIKNPNVKIDHTNVAQGAINLVDVECANSTYRKATYFPNATNLYASGSETSGSSVGKNCRIMIMDNVQPGKTEADGLNGQNGYTFYLGDSDTTFMGLAGVEHKDAELLSNPMVYNFPEEIAAGNRSTIKYDYLGSDGHRYKISALSGNIQSYKIKSNACNTTWAMNLIIPEAVTEIGSNAFYGAHVEYLDLTVGENGLSIAASAFANNSTSVLYAGRQYFYVRGKKAATLTSSSFGSSTVSSRTVIFESNALYTSYTSRANFRGNVTTYQVPVKTQATSDDAVEIEGGDILTRFRTDTDVKDGSYMSVDGKTYTYTYTKRLQSDTSLVKDSNGVSWSAGSMAMPNIAGNQSTKWYRESNAATLENPTEVTSVNDLFGTGYSAAGVTMYSVKVTGPSADELKNKTFVYGSDDIKGKSVPDIAFDGKYGAAIVAFITAANNTIAPGSSTFPTNIENAGVYTVEARLDPKWGVWADATAANYRITVTVERAPIDLSDPDNLSWVLQDGTSSSFEGDNTTLYQYEDGWYDQEQGDKGDPISTAVVTDSYILYAEGISRSPMVNVGEESVVTNESSEGRETSSRYTSSADIAVDGYNYKYVINSREELRKRGIEISLDTSVTTSNYYDKATVTKTWYIVKVSNWLVMADDVNSNFDIPARTYGETKEVKLPALKYGSAEDNAKLTFTIRRNGAVIEGIGESAIPATDFKKYINASMPAGTYAISIGSPDSVTIADGNESVTYPAVRQSFNLTVGSRDIYELTYQKQKDGEPEKLVDAINDLLQGLKFEHAYRQGDGLWMHPYMAAASELNELLNTNIHSTRDKSEGTENNIWNNSRYDSFYEPVSITYNLNSLQTSAYYSAAVLNSNFGTSGNIPVGVGDYTVYYQLSAPSHTSLWNVNAANADTARRDYRYDVKIYRQIPVPTLSDRTYTGSAILPQINHSAGNEQYYTYTYETQDNVNVEGDHYVTFTLNDPTLSRWLENGVELKDKVVYAADFVVERAENSWRTLRIPGWTYNGFDRTLQVIRAQTEFETGIEFSVRKEGEDGYITFTKTEGETETEVETFELDKDGYIPEFVAEKLNSLPVGTYYLEAMAQASTNFYEAGYEYDFYIDQATNGWITPPSIPGWSQGDWVENYLPTARSRFGDIHVWITYEMNGNLNEVSEESPGENGEYTGRVYYDAMYAWTVDKYGNDVLTCDTVAGLGNGSIEFAPGGWYILHAEVKGSDSYTGIPEAMNRFQIFTGSVGRPANTWAKSDVPSMGSWTAGSTPSTPKGTPLRGKVEYTYYTMVENKETGEWEKGEKLDEQPEAPGSYVVVMTVVSDGIVDFKPEWDKLEEEVRFEIYKRVNDWDVHPNIDSWSYTPNPTVKPTATAKFGGEAESSISYLFKKEGEDDDRAVSELPTVPGNYIMITTATAKYSDPLVHKYPFTISSRFNQWKVSPGILSWQLGEEASVPVGTAELEDSEITFMYKVRGADDSTLTNVKPVEAGDYTMVVTAKALYSEDLVARIDFSVTLSQNKWVSLPTIVDWSAEYAPNLPTGEALFGDITYRYETTDGRVLDGAPTEEGEYVLRAIVEVDGFATLESEYNFTVTPAFDPTLVNLDIVLAFVACVFTIIVIIFAVRRYKQC